MPKPKVNKDKSLCPTDRREMVDLIRTSVLGLKFEEKAWLFSSVLEMSSSAQEKEVVWELLVLLQQHFGERPVGFEPSKRKK